MNNIEILEEFIKEFKETPELILSIKGVRREKEFKAIENLIQENKELKEKNNRIKSLDYATLAEEMEMGLWMPRADVEEYYIPIENLNDYIPKSKVKAMLVGITKEHSSILSKNIYSLNDKNIATFQYNAMRKILEELLEEGE